MRGVKHEFGMLFTHESRLTPELERSNTRGRLAQAPGNWEESARRGEGGGRAASTALGTSAGCPRVTLQVRRPYSRRSC